MIHISLFSGIGGFEIAAEWMGWRNLVSCDINEFGNKVRKYYWPDGYCHTDIKTLTYEKIDSELSARFGTRWRDDDIILTGGFPCQPYSAAGKRLGKEDERHLWPEMLRVIQEVKPTYIVGENVRGLTNWNGGVVFEEVCADLEACGYEVQPLLLPACAVGAPHRRDRVWFVAHAVNNRHSARRKEESGQNGLQRVNRQKMGTGKFDGANISRNAPHSNSNGLNQCDCQHEIDPSQGGQHALGDTQQGDVDGNAADTDNKGLQRGQNIDQRKKYNSEWGRDGIILGTNSKNIGSSSSSNFKDFTTQSPICSGDDGLPTQLDGITFPKWRNESIKAYGNAIVPQVAFEIFKVLVREN